MPGASSNGANFIATGKTNPVALALAGVCIVLVEMGEIEGVFVSIGDGAPAPRHEGSKTEDAYVGLVLRSKHGEGGGGLVAATQGGTIGVIGNL
jgi:hypothetical protein